MSRLIPFAGSVDASPAKTSHLARCSLRGCPVPVGLDERANADVYCNVSPNIERDGHCHGDRDEDTVLHRDQVPYKGHNQRQ